MHKHRTQNFRRISPFGITPVKKKHKRLGHAGIVDHSVDLSIPDFKKIQQQQKKEWREVIQNFEILYKCIIANTGVIWQHAAPTTDQLSSPNC